MIEGFLLFEVEFDSNSIFCPIFGRNSRKCPLFCLLSTWVAHLPLCAVSYKYDFFISYSRRGSVQKWLLTHFYKKLVEYLADEFAPAPKVYMDRSMPRGVDWPSNLENSLRHSKIMVPLLTPPYFESEWCMAELESMRAREKLLGLAGAGHPQGLVYPILYSDSDNFPVEERIRSWRDFKEYADPDPVFQESRSTISFPPAGHEFWRRTSSQLAEQVPEWQPGLAAHRATRSGAACRHRRSEVRADDRDRRSRSTPTRAGSGAASRWRTSRCCSPAGVTGCSRSTGTWRRPACTTTSRPHLPKAPESGVVDLAYDFLAGAQDAERPRRAGSGGRRAGPDRGWPGRRAGRRRLPGRVQGINWEDLYQQGFADVPRTLPRRVDRELRLRADRQPHRYLRHRRASAPRSCPTGWWSCSPPTSRASTVRWTSPSAPTAPGTGCPTTGNGTSCCRSCPGSTTGWSTSGPTSGSRSAPRSPRRCSGTGWRRACRRT